MYMLSNPFNECNPYVQQICTNKVCFKVFKSHRLFKKDFRTVPQILIQYVWVASKNLYSNKFQMLLARDHILSDAVVHVNKITVPLYKGREIRWLATD